MCWVTPWAWKPIKTLMCIQPRGKEEEEAKKERELCSVESMSKQTGIFPPLPSTGLLIQSSGL